jgi:serine/threonine protein kinase
LNNSKLFQRHSNLINLIAIEFDKNKVTEKVDEVKLIFEKVNGVTLEDFIKD